MSEEDTVMDENKSERQDEKARRRSLVESSRKVGRRFFLKVAGLGLAHFALINAASPKEALADTCVAPVSDTCETLLGYHTDSCNPNSGDVDQCFPEAPYDYDDQCLGGLGDPDLCESGAGYEKVDVCRPANSDPDVCNPKVVGHKDTCDPSVNDTDVCEGTYGESVTPESIWGPATAELPPEGGVADDGEGTKAVFPAGALSAPTSIWIATPSFGNETTEDGKRIVVAREFAPGGLEFNAPVQLTIPCTPSEAAGSDENSLGLYLLDEPTGRWQPCPFVGEGSAVTGYRLTTTVNHFSIYGIGGTLPPVSASKNWALALLGFLGLAILGRFGHWSEDKTETRTED
jgi:hypothetical protein